MKRILYRAMVCVMLLCFVACSGVSADSHHSGEIRSYKDIPGITDEEIAAVEALLEERSGFTYGQMPETEAFVLDDGTYAGFVARFTELLTELFGVPFTLTLMDWTPMIEDLDAHRLDFTGDLTQTPERMQRYYMTHPIAERSQRIFTLVGSGGVKTPKDTEGMRMGFLKGSVDGISVSETYPELALEVVYVGDFETAKAMLIAGEIDAFTAEGVIDPLMDEPGVIQSKEFYPLVYSPVSMTTANPALEPIIAVMNRYLAAGGIDILFNMYVEGDNDYARFKLMHSLTEEERAYLDHMEASGTAVRVAIESENYPVGFYNENDKAFQGISVEVLEEISNLTGLEFTAYTDKDSTWLEIMEMLDRGEVDLVTEMLFTEERASRYLFTKTPYTTTNVALLSREEYPNLAIYQVVRAKVGVIRGSAYAQKKEEWFSDSATLEYDSQIEALDALDTGEIDLLMGSDHMLLSQINYREMPGYKANIRLNTAIDSYFGLNPDQALLCSIMSKAQDFVKTDTIVSNWSSRGYDYSKQLTRQRSIMLLCIVALLTLLLIATIIYLQRHKKLSRGLEETVRERTRALEEQTQAAYVASKAKGDFLAHMSHEIRTPLNAIIGMANIAKNALDEPDKLAQSINQIITSSHHLLSVLNDVLDMSKIEAGKMELSREPFSLPGAMSEVSGIIAQRCLDKGIRFITNAESLSHITLMGDKLLLNQVLINLLGNAVKFTDEGGEITFTADVLEESDTTARIAFSVADDGIGMSEEQASRLFRPFEQADNTIAAKYGGTGLGLSISQNIVGLMNGVIEVKSAPGQGSAFRFELSFDKGEPVAEDAPAVAETPQLNGKRILLTEDIEINRVIVCELLAGTGADIVEAENGQAALELFEQSPEGCFDLIFMDVQMPIMDGYEATRRIRALDRADAKRVAVIAMTANAYKEDVAEALAAGMNGHLAKPIDVDALMSALAKYTVHQKEA